MYWKNVKFENYSDLDLCIKNYLLKQVGFIESFGLKKFVRKIYLYIMKIINNN